MIDALQGVALAILAVTVYVQGRTIRLMQERMVRRWGPADSIDKVKGV